MNTEQFFNLVNRPGFGTLFQGSSRFRGIFKELVSSSVDEDIQQFASRLSVEFDEEGEMVFRAPALRHTFRRETGESYYDMFQRVMRGSGTDPLDPTSGGIGLGGVRTADIIRGTAATRTYQEQLANNFRFGREYLGRVAQENNLEIIYRTLENTSENVRLVRQMLSPNREGGEPLGWMQADDEGIKLFRAYDPVNKRFLEMSDSLRLLGVKADEMHNIGTVRKRLNQFYNAPAVQVHTKPGEIKRIVFDPARMFDDATRKSMEAFAAREVANDVTGQLTHAKALERVYSTTTDGMVMLRKSWFVDRMKQMKNEELDAARRKFYDDRKAGLLTQDQYTRAMQELNRQSIQLGELIENIEKGAVRTNFRVSGRIDVVDSLLTKLRGAGDKGDAILVEDDRFNTALRKINDQLFVATDEHLMQYNLMSSNKGITELGPLDDVNPFFTLDVVSRRGEAVSSNALQVMAHGHLMNPINPQTGRPFLIESLENTIDTRLAEIRQGKMGGFSKLIDDILRIDPLTLPNESDAQELKEMRRYAIRIKHALESGESLAENDLLMKDAHRILKSHLFRGRKGKTGRMIPFGDEIIQDPALRIEQWRSEAGHYSVVDAVTEDLNTIQDRLNLSYVLKPNVDGGFGIRPTDIVGVKAAHGGADLDDAFNLNHFNYDPETKRMLAFMDRSPQYQGEYMWMDAEWASQRSFEGAKVRLVDANGVERMVSASAAQAERQKILLEIRKHALKARDGKAVTQETAAEARRLFRRLNRYNRAFDEFLSEQKGITRQRLSEIYSMDDETQAFRRTYAPKGWGVTKRQLRRYREGSIFRSYQTMSNRRLRDIEAVLRRVNQEIDLDVGDMTRSRAPNPLLPFEFIGESYDEMLTGAGGVGESDLYEDFRVRHRAEIAEFNRRMATLKETKGSIDEFMWPLNKSATVTKGLLGRSVNAAALIRHTYEANTSLLAGAPSREHIFAFRAAVSAEGRALMAPGETVIDAITKTGDSIMLNIITQDMANNLIAFGRVLGKTGVGLDPLGMQQRASIGAKNWRLVLQGYREAVEAGAELTDEEITQRLTLPIDDPRASLAQLHTETMKAQEAMVETMIADQEAASEQLLSQLEDIVPDAETRAEAEALREEYFQGRRRLRQIRGNHEEQYRMLLEAADGNLEGIDDFGDLFSDMSENELNLATMRRIKGWNLTGEALYERLLGVAKVFAEARVTEEGARFSAIEPLMQISTWDQVSSTDELYYEARRWQRERAVRSAIMTKADEFRDFIPGPDESFSISQYFSRHINRIAQQAGVDEIVDTVAFDQTRLRAAQRIRDLGGEGYDKFLRKLAYQRGTYFEGMTSADIEEEIMEFEPRVETPARLLQAEGPAGVRRLAARSMADDASSTVIKTVTQRRFAEKGLRAEFDRMLSLPGFRRGMGAAGIFAGLGMFHILRGERTPEQMQGPPMLPAGSAYEDMPRQALPMPAIASGPTTGYTYRVRAQGSFDTTQLNNELRNITGTNINGTIYDSSGAYNPAGTSTAVDILNTLLEG
jgi:hypothetical protein